MSQLLPKPKMKTTLTKAVDSAMGVSKASWKQELLNVMKNHTTRRSRSRIMNVKLQRRRSRHRRRPCRSLWTASPILPALSPTRLFFSSARRKMPPLERSPPPRKIVSPQRGLFYPRRQKRVECEPFVVLGRVSSLPFVAHILFLFWIRRGVSMASKRRWTSSTSSPSR